MGMKRGKIQRPTESQRNEGALLGALWNAVAPGHCRRWQLQDAKSQFSEVVQRALEGTPQCVTKHGKDAVIVISYDALVQAVRPKQNLYEFFRSSPLVGADLNFERVPGEVREVDL
jgi:antitoxin Phd